MTQQNGSFASNSALVPSGGWSYFALFGMQTIGAPLVFSGPLSLLTERF
jgi:hypothetical protein